MKINSPHISLLANFSRVTDRNQRLKKEKKKGEGRKERRSKLIQDLLEISTRENLCQEGRGVETSPEIALWNLASKNNASKGNTRGGALWNVISVERVRDWLLLTHGNLSSPGITVPWNESTGRLNKLLQPPRYKISFSSLQERAPCFLSNDKATDRGLVWADLSLRWKIWFSCFPFKFVSLANF